MEMMRVQTTSLSIVRHMVSGVSLCQGHVPSIRTSLDVNCIVKFPEFAFLSISWYVLDVSSVLCYMGSRMLKSECY